MTESYRTIERYELCDRIASGGMGVVHLGHLHGTAGFRRIVAIKRLHSKFVRDRDFVRAFVEEARLAARIRHPNVVPILDTLRDKDEIFIVLEYIHGETLHRLHTLREHHPPPIAISAAIVRGVLEGLHAAHGAVDEHGAPLKIVHRDVSPQNILVGVDGVPRLLDFGVATALGRTQNSPNDRKGKISYMAPEQLVSGEVSPRSDVYSAAVVLWEALTGRRLFKSTLPLTLFLDVELSPPSAFNKAVPPELDKVVMRGLERNAALRYPTAREMSIELERGTVLATMREIGHWVDVRAGKLLRARGERIAAIEQSLMPAAELEGGTPSPEFHDFDDVEDRTTNTDHALPDPELLGPELIHPQANAILSFAIDADFQSSAGHNVVITTKKEILDWSRTPTLWSPPPLDVADEDDVDLVPTQKGTVAPQRPPRRTPPKSYPPPMRRPQPSRARPIAIAASLVLAFLMLVWMQRLPPEPESTLETTTTEMSAVRSEDGDDSQVTTTSSEGEKPQKARETKKRSQRLKKFNQDLRKPNRSIR